MCCPFSSCRASGTTRYYIVGCYIPPNDKTTLTHIEQAWMACLKGFLPFVFRGLNTNLAAPRNERDEMIAEQVDTMNMVDMSSHFCQRWGENFHGRWTWRMRRERRWVSSQCDYNLGRATDLGRFWRISVQLPFCPDSDHRALVAKIVQGGMEMKKYRKRYRRFPLRVPQGTYQARGSV